MKKKNSIMAVIISLTMLLLTACGSYSNESSVVTARNENTSENIGENTVISVTESIPEDESKTTNNPEQGNMTTKFDFESKTFCSTAAMRCRLSVLVPGRRTMIPQKTLFMKR